VESFVKSIKPELKVRIFELNDPFGETIEVEDIDALVISEETLKAGEKVNE
jgi:phosphopantetheine adenylyltransferase